MLRILTTLCLLALAAPLAAEPTTRTLVYSDGATTLSGMLALPEAEGPRPGVLVVHEWWGLGQHPRRSALRLAELGYVALALDMYGDGYLTDKVEEAARLSRQIKDNPDLAEKRFSAAMTALRDVEACAPDRIAAIGYCFGGSVVLEMARRGFDLRGVVSFHGGLEPMGPRARGAIPARILVLHGADDPFVSAEEVQGFQDEMREAGADWQMNYYGGAVHSFTNPEVGRHNLDGAAYQPEAARRSWAAMRLFLDQLFD